MLGCAQMDINNILIHRQEPFKHVGAADVSRYTLSLKELVPMSTTAAPLVTLCCGLGLSHVLYIHIFSHSVTITTPRLL